MRRGANVGKHIWEFAADASLKITRTKRGDLTIIGKLVIGRREQRGNFSGNIGGSILIDF